MYENFGAVITDKKVEFRLFLPDNTVDPAQYVRGGDPKIKEIRIRGDFQSSIGGTDWEFNSAPVMSKNPHPQGWLYTHKINANLPEGFYQYKYFVTFENETSRWVSDPCSKYGGAGENENAAFVIGGNTTTVDPVPNRLPPADLVMYELMIDDFTGQFRGNRAPIDAVHDRLDYLQDLGVNAIEFMPWTSWPGGGFSWGYDPYQFFAVEYRYVHDGAAPADKLYRLKTLINELHKRDIHVIMDGVFNHVRAGTNPNRGFPYRWLYQDPEDSPYIGEFAPLPYGFFEDFDYENRCVQEFIRDVCIYWLDVYEIDGIRFDFTLGFFREGDPDAGITKLISDVKDYLSQKGKENVALMLEHLTDNRFDAISDTNEVCATGCWFDPMMFKFHEYSGNGNIDMEILRRLNASLDFAADKSPVTYIENHDHSTIVSAVGGRGRWFKTQPSAIALLTSPGIVMIHNGQEFGEDYFLPGSGSDRVKPRELRWNEHSADMAGNALYALYKKLIQIRKDYPSLRSPNFFPFPFNVDGYGAFPQKDVVIYHRYGEARDGTFERFIIVVNYSDFDQYIDIPFSTNGQWEDILNQNADIVDNFHLASQKINSNWGRIYYRKE
jgi:1,4-alpha-glucan branching enzyme